MKAPYDREPGSVPPELRASKPAIEQFVGDVQAAFDVARELHYARTPIGGSTVQVGELVFPHPDSGIDDQTPRVNQIVADKRHGVYMGDKGDAEVLAALGNDIETGVRSSMQLTFYRTRVAPLMRGEQPGEAGRRIVAKLELEKGNAAEPVEAEVVTLYDDGTVSGFEKAPYLVKDSDGNTQTYDHSGPIAEKHPDKLLEVLGEDMQGILAATFGEEGLRIASRNRYQNAIRDIVNLARLGHNRLGSDNHGEEVITHPGTALEREESSGTWDLAEVVTEKRGLYMTEKDGVMVVGAHGIDPENPEDHYTIMVNSDWSQGIASLLMVKTNEITGAVTQQEAAVSDHNTQIRTVQSIDGLPPIESDIGDVMAHDNAAIWAKQALDLMRRFARPPEANKEYQDAYDSLLQGLEDVMESAQYGSENGIGIKRADMPDIDIEEAQLNLAGRTGADWRIEQLDEAYGFSGEEAYFGQDTARNVRMFGLIERLEEGYDVTQVMYRDGFVELLQSQRNFRNRPEAGNGIVASFETLSVLHDKRQFHRFELRGDGTIRMQEGTVEGGDHDEAVIPDPEIVGQIISHISEVQNRYFGGR